MLKRLALITVFILICFFLSGLTGLIYEILWTRMLVKIIGGAPFAVSIVLTVFMAGLGIGSFFAGRLVDKIEKPGSLIKLYGLLELVIALFAILIPLAIDILAALLVHIQPRVRPFPAVLLSDAGRLHDYPDRACYLYGGDTSRSLPVMRQEYFEYRTKDRRDLWLEYHRRSHRCSGLRILADWAIWDADYPFNSRSFELCSRFFLPFSRVSKAVFRKCPTNYRRR